MYWLYIRIINEEYIILTCDGSVAVATVLEHPFPT